MGGATEGMRRYYAGLSRESELASRCVMDLPRGLEGKRVLDVGCRRGKGVYKLSDFVGPDGLVVGVDPSAAFIEEARRRLAENVGAGRRESGRCREIDDDLPAASAVSRGVHVAGLERGVAFLCGYPEDLTGCGIPEGSFDVVIINSVLNVAYDVARCLREALRALAPGGSLYHPGLFVGESEREEPERVGGSGVFGRARSLGSFSGLLDASGFTDVAVFDERPARPRGSDCVGAGAGTAYVEAVVRARRPLPTS